MRTLPFQTNIASATTDGAVVAAVPGRRLRIVQAVIQAGGTATSVVFNSKPAGAGTAITQVFTIPANTVLTLPFSECGYGDTNSGEGLTCTTGTGSTVELQGQYRVL